MRIARTIGNKELWRREKTLFLTSRRAPMVCYEKVFRWVEGFDRWQCAVCFNTSELEEEVLKALLVCHVPTVLVVTGKLLTAFNFGIRCSQPQHRDFIMGEVRYNSLMKTFFTGLDLIQRCSDPLTGYPQEAEELFVATERNAKIRYEGYKKLSEM